MKLLFSLFLSLMVFSSIHAKEGAYVTFSDIEKSSLRYGDELFVDVDAQWHPVKSLQSDEYGFYYLLTGRKHKYESSKDSEAELSCIVQCPDCSRLQTCTKVAHNKGHCSQCRYIFPASDFSWKCTNCGTQNYLNPVKCGRLDCLCPRHLCDPDVKTNRT